MTRQAGLGSCRIPTRLSARDHGAEQRWRPARAMLPLLIAPSRRASSSGNPSNDTLHGALPPRVSLPSRPPVAGSSARPRRPRGEPLRKQQHRLHQNLLLPRRRMRTPQRLPRHLWRQRRRALRRRARPRPSPPRRPSDVRGAAGGGRGSSSRRRARSARGGASRAAHPAAPAWWTRRGRFWRRPRLSSWSRRPRGPPAAARRRTARWRAPRRTRASLPGGSQRGLRRPFPPPRRSSRPRSGAPRRPGASAPRARRGGCSRRC